jgi:diguanylate cyclase (GGDEF)-like protein
MAHRADFSNTIVASAPSVAEQDDGHEVLLIVMSGNSVGRIFPLERARPLTVIGRDDDSDLQVMDAEISRRHAAIRYEAESNHFIITDLNSRNGTRINGEPPVGDVTLQIGDKIQLGNITVLRVSRSDEAEAQYARKMYQAALLDGLTGAYNRRYLDERLGSELAFAKRHSAALSVLLADLDNFKQANDDHGHRAGDFVLKRFVELLQQHVRAEDVVARYGGEEFCVLCRDTDEQQASVLAERLRHSVEAEPFTFEGQRIIVTVSIGIAGAREQKSYDPQRIIELSDQALYAAKASGRNCWRIAAS